MNVTEFESQMSVLGIEGSGFDSKTKVDIRWKDGTVTPANTSVHIWFSPKNLPSKMFIQTGDRVYQTRISGGNLKYVGITKVPSLRTMEKYSWDGIAKTVTGFKTEPDGFGPDGSPSWMLVEGII